MYCQRQTKDNLVRSSSVKPKNHNANATYTKIATNIERFDRLDQSPIALQFQEIDKKLLTKLFIKNDAKFHKSCTNQFSDMKIERAEKNYEQMKIRSQKMLLVQNKVAALQFRETAKEDTQGQDN